MQSDSEEKATSGSASAKAGSGKNGSRSSETSSSEARNGTHSLKGDQGVESAGSTSGENENVVRGARVSAAKLEPLGVSVETNLDKAMKILKRKLIKEGLFKELKTRRYFEKPSEKKKRKMKETLKKLRKEESRARKNNFLG